MPTDAGHLNEFDPESDGMRNDFNDEAAGMLIKTAAADAKFLECMETLNKLNHCKEEEIINELQKYVVGRSQVEKKVYVPLSQGEMAAINAEPDLGEDQPPEFTHESDDEDEDSHVSDQDNMDDEFESDSTEDIVDHVQNSAEFMQDIIEDFLNSKGLPIDNQDSNQDKFFKSLREIMNQYEARPTPIIKEGLVVGSADVVQKVPDIIETFQREEKVRHEEVIAPIIYQERQMVMTAETVRKIKIAADSGAVDHIANANNLPGNVVLKKTDKHRDFINASGGGIKNHGEANVRLKTKQGKMIGNTFQVADVCRPLHSVGKVCDGGHEILFMKNRAVVVPEGSLAKFLDGCQHLVTYEREDGLYVVEVEVSAVPDESLASFRRPDASK